MREFFFIFTRAGTVRLSLSCLPWSQLPTSYSFKNRGTHIFEVSCLLKTSLQHVIHFEIPYLRWKNLTSSLYGNWSHNIWLNANCMSCISEGGQAQRFPKDSLLWEPIDHVGQRDRLGENIPINKLKPDWSDNWCEKRGQRACLCYPPGLSYWPFNLSSSDWPANLLSIQRETRRKGQASPPCISVRPWRGGVVGGVGVISTPHTPKHLHVQTVAAYLPFPSTIFASLPNLLHRWCFATLPKKVRPHRVSTPNAKVSD